MRDHLYRLAADGRTPEPVDDVLTWARWFETAPRIVAQTSIGDVIVSTVFLGLDHQWGRGAPLLWETMAFGKDMTEQACERYVSFADAVSGHARMVERFSERHA